MHTVEIVSEAMPMTPNDKMPDASHCAGCDLPASRRRFLRDAFLSVASALVAVGVSRTSALAMPLEFTEGKRRGDQTVNYPIPTTDGAQIDKKNEVILVRWQGAMYAFTLSCPHQNTALRWSDGDHQFECPKHHSRFQPNGDYVAESGRATRNMDRFAVVRSGDNVTVDLDKLYQEDSDGTQWAAAIVKL
jgi:nitrite reductase/ring-hydroxylating ferredoxin subunit